MTKYSRVMAKVHIQHMVQHNFVCAIKQPPKTSILLQGLYDMLTHEPWTLGHVENVKLEVPMNVPYRSQERA